MIDVAPATVIYAGICIVFDQIGDWLWEKGIVSSHWVKGIRLHHSYIYLTIPAFALVVWVIR